MFSGAASRSRVNQILILLVFGNKTMFKLFRSARPSGGEYAAAPHSIVPLLIYSLWGASVHLQNHYSQLVLNT